MSERTLSIYVAHTSEVKASTLATLYFMKSIITEIKRLDQAATKGPWEFAIESGLAMVSTETFAVPGTCDCDIYDEEEGANNQQLIAFYRNNTPVLAEAYEKLLEVAESMAKALDASMEHAQGWFRLSRAALNEFNALKPGETGAAQ